MQSIHLVVFIFITAMICPAVAMAQPAHASAQGAREPEPVLQRAERHHRSHAAERKNEDRIDLPRINEREVLSLLHQFEAPQAESVPPGIQRQWERGKPLPPGMGKRFERQFASQLPHYPGYEWGYVGADVILMESTTRVITDVWVDALRMNQ